MAKYIYLLRSAHKAEQAAFKAQMFEELVPQLLHLNPEKLKVNFVIAKLPRLTVLPLKRNGLAMISIWHTNPGECTALISLWAKKAGLAVEGYEVSESTPVSYSKDWSDGMPSPGVVMLTIMRKNRRLSRDQFMSEWFGRHSPMAIRIHPLWNYIRNVVDGPVVDGSPALDGLVEEHFWSLKDITSPVRFFGGWRHFLPNMVRVGRHALKFLNFTAVENYLLTEYHVRSESIHGDGAARKLRQAWISSASFPR